MIFNNKLVFKQIHYFYLFLFLFFFLSPKYILSKDDLNCSLCHNYKDLIIIDGDGNEKSFYINKDLFNNLVHKKLNCETCHFTIIQTPHLPEQLKKVDCNSICHVNDPSVDKAFIHEPEYNEFKKSAHGDRVENPIGCACHNNHLMGKVKELSPLEINSVCAYKCHENKLLMYKYKLSPLTVYTYLDSYHGEAIKFNQNKYPTCLTCHSNHNTKIKEEKDSPINKKNRLEKVCAKKDCHKSGMEKSAFVEGTYHQIYKKDEISKKIFLDNLEKTYYYIIIFTAIFSCLFYVLRFASKARRKRIWINILVISIIMTIIFIPYILQSFIKEKGVRFVFNTSPIRYKSICLDCHSFYPHHKNLVMRAFMNLHSKKVACEVCHVRSHQEILAVDREEKRLESLKKVKVKEGIIEIEEKPLVISREERAIIYKWYNGGKTRASILRRMDGDDGAQIMLFKVLGDNKFEILEATKEKGIDPDFRISPKAIQCKDCHNEKGLMDFRSLGYPEKMVKEKLEKSRAFEMLQKSEKFLIPKLF